MQPSRPRPVHPEGKIHGVAACEAVFRARPDDIVRGYFSEAVAKRFGPLMRFLAQRRRAYHIVGEDELERVAETKHHGGVCLLVRRRSALTVEAWLARLGGSDACLLALEGVGNPHNLGAILRSAAHFGAKAVLSTDPALLQSGAAARVAEGGAEAVALLEADSLAAGLKALRAAGFKVLATSSHQGESVFATALPKRCVILLGEEQHGLSAQALRDADLTVRIPGSGAVESLNVSVAAAILLAEYWRQNAAPAARLPGKLTLGKRPPRRSDR